MANFLLLIENLTSYSKQDVDKGNTPLDVYTMCSCIRETFCLSYAIRKENNLLIFLIKELSLIKLEGARLRYMGSDERSQSLLLSKAISKIGELKSQKKENWQKSTPGIYVKAFNTYDSFIHYFHSLDNTMYTMIFDSISPFDIAFLAHTYDFPNIVKFKAIENLDSCIFLLSEEKAVLIDLIRNLVRIFPAMLEKLLLTPLKRIKTLEDKILYINYQIDQQ